MEIFGTVERPLFLLEFLETRRIEKKGRLMRKILVLGATSAIGQETARLFSRDGDSLYLVARNGQRLMSVAKDLRTRGAAKVGTRTVDLLDTDNHEEIIIEAIEYLGGLDIALVSYGSLGDQKAAEKCYKVAEHELKTNLLSVLSLLISLANVLEKQGSGSIAVISSVSGDRGRKSNYVYGTAKGGLSIFLQGLRNRLHASGVTVVTVKPGFVETPMTAEFKKNILFASAGEVANGIYRAIIRKKDVVYLPFFWRPIMAAIRLLPESIFKKMNL
jgi:hypothetical protein